MRRSRKGAGIICRSTAVIAKLQHGESKRIDYAATPKGTMSSGVTSSGTASGRSSMGAVEPDFDVDAAIHHSSAWFSTASSCRSQTMAPECDKQTWDRMHAPYALTCCLLVAFASIAVYLC